MNFIYITTNIVNGKQYIGSHSTDNMNDGYIGSGRCFLRSVKKYGRKNFKREILEECEPSLNLILEEKYIKDYNTLSPDGYNLSPTGGHGLRGKVSEKTIEKIRKSNFGQKRSNDTKKKIAESKKGQKNRFKDIGFKEGFIEKYGELEGAKRYQKFLENQSKSHIGKIPWNKGKSIIESYGEEKAEEIRRKIRNANIGLKQSLETIEKRRKKHLGRKNTEETKKKMSLASRGKPKTYDVWNKGKTQLNITPELIWEVKRLNREGMIQKKIASMKNLSTSCISRMIRGFYDDKIRILK